MLPHNSTFKDQAKGNTSVATSSSLHNNNNDTNPCTNAHFSDNGCALKPQQLTDPKNHLLNFFYEWTGHIVQIETISGKSLVGVLVGISPQGELGIKNVVMFPDPSNTHEIITKKALMKGELQTLRTITLLERAPQNKEKNSFRMDQEVAKVSSQTRLFTPTFRNFDGGKDLTPFFEDGIINSRFMGDEDEDCLNIPKKGDAWWTPQEMVALNDEKFSLKLSAFNEDDYTVPIDRNHPDFEKKLREAERISREIEAEKAAAKSNRNKKRKNFDFEKCPSDREGSDAEEENRYASVIRKEESNQVQSQPDADEVALNKIAEETSTTIEESSIDLVVADSVKNDENDDTKVISPSQAETPPETSENDSKAKETSVKEPRWNLQAKEFIPGAKMFSSNENGKESSWSSNYVQPSFQPQAVMPPPQVTMYNYPPSANLSYTNDTVSFIEHPPIGLMSFPPPIPFNGQPSALPSELFRPISAAAQYPGYSQNVELSTSNNQLMIPTSTEDSSFTTSAQPPTDATTKSVVAPVSNNVGELASTVNHFVQAHGYFPQHMFPPFPSHPTQAPFVWNPFSVMGGATLQPPPSGATHPQLTMPPTINLGQPHQPGFFYPPGGSHPSYSMPPQTIFSGNNGLHQMNMAPLPPGAVSNFLPMQPGVLNPQAPMNYTPDMNMMAINPTHANRMFMSAAGMLKPGAVVQGTPILDPNISLLPFSDNNSTNSRNIPHHSTTNSTLTSGTLNLIQGESTPHSILSPTETTEVDSGNARSVSSTQELAETVNGLSDHDGPTK